MIVRVLVVQGQENIIRRGRIVDPKRMDDAKSVPVPAERDVDDAKSSPALGMTRSQSQKPLFAYLLCLSLREAVVFVLRTLRSRYGDETKVGQRRWGAEVGREEK